MHRRITIRRPDLHWVFGQRANTWHAHVTWHIARTWHMAHGTWHMAHGTWHMAHGTWHMAHGTWHMAHGTWHMVCDLFDGKCNQQANPSRPTTYDLAEHARTHHAANCQRPTASPIAMSSGECKPIGRHVSCGMWYVWCMGGGCVVCGMGSVA
jgi:hypothetical protein